jgi:hypothetical protein
MELEIIIFPLSPLFPLSPTAYKKTVKETPFIR